MFKKWEDILMERFHEINWFDFFYTIIGVDQKLNENSQNSEAETPHIVA